MILYMEGTERYLKLKEIKKAASLLADKDFCYQEFWIWDDSILEFISAPPFFGDKKICVLYFFPEDDRLLKLLSGRVQTFISLPRICRTEERTLLHSF